MFLTTVLAARGPGAGGIRLLAALAILGHPCAAVAGDTRDGPEFRNGPAELRWCVPYQAGKTPVVFVHGFLGSRVNWTVMIDSLSADTSVRAHFQLLTFDYDCLQPIPESGLKLLAAFDEAARRADPERRDHALDQVILVGHSLGGLVAKAAALGFDRGLAGVGNAPPGGHAPAPSSRVGRLIFVATPHRGTTVDQGAVRTTAIWFARSFHPLSSAPPREGAAGAENLATSVDQLTWDHPVLAGLQRAGAAAGIPFHSIIASLQDPSGPEPTDGLVPVASARLGGARSELLVRTNHFCFQHREVIAEVRRILIEQATGPVNKPRSAHERTR